MTPIKWFLGFLKKYRIYIVIGMVLTVFITALNLVNPYISKIILDDVINGGKYDLLPKMLALMIICVTVKGIFRFLYQYVFETASQGTLYDMRDAVYRRLLHEDFAFFNRRRTGDLMSRQTGDMDAIRHFVAYVIYAVFENVLLFVSALVMVFTVNPRMALMMLAVLPFTALTTVMQSKRSRPAAAQKREAFSSLNAFVQENVAGNRVVRAFSKEDYELGRFQEENYKYGKAQTESAFVGNMVFVPIFEVLAYALNIVLIVYGGYLCIKGDMTIGQFVQINGYLWMLNNPLRQAGWLVNDILNFTTSVDKIYETYQEEPEIKNPENGYDKPLRGEVEFRDVSYRAGDSDIAYDHYGRPYLQEIVHDINFKVAPGQTVGILGTTGSGKTTIMNLLCRFYDVSSGQILVDGVDVRDIDLYHLRDSIGLAAQDVFLFSDTIEGNISYGRPDATLEEVHDAAVMADANHFIRELPEGYQTVVGERGTGLSGGQKQRISLARALIKKPSILILDDTTSAVDMETESYIQSQLEKIADRCTVFVIAYRISSIKDADLILVMDKGHIIESGTHDELVAAGGYYAAAFHNQYGEIPKEIYDGQE